MKVNRKIVQNIRFLQKIELSQVFIDAYRFFGARTIKAAKILNSFSKVYNENLD